MSSKSPVLLITFNRPEMALKVLDQIRLYQPDRLYVASDAARENVDGEKELVAETRKKVLENIDWECEVHTLFREVNVGCGAGPSTAIGWMFETEESGIILEDDCIPQPEFFSYCETLLERYKDNQRVWVISGRNEYPTGKFFDKYDYLFTNYTSTWGWATWKRCWKHYDITIPQWNEFYSNGGFKNVQFGRLESIYFNLAYLKALRDKNLREHVWDYQFSFIRKINGGLSIFPKVNLIENIGYVGTHFSGITKDQMLKSESGFNLLKHPLIVLPSRAYEASCFRVSVLGTIQNKLIKLKRAITG